MYVNVIFYPPNQFYVEREALSKPNSALATLQKIEYVMRRDAT